MITETVDRNVRIGGMGANAVSFSIDEEDFGFVSSILTNKLYSNKPLAIIREYICNAIDTNKEANASRNILITPPSTFDPTYKVRDFGFGLSFDDVTKTYVKLGKSTKRLSNELIGTFGLGSKAGFAYTDSFNIISWYKGVRYAYTAQKDKTSRLQLFPLGETPSDEPSGIEISIAINENEITYFNQTLAEFCKYLSVPIDFDGNFKKEEIKYLCKFDDFFIEERPAYGYGNRFNCKVLMGNVVYPVDTQHLKYDYRGVSNVVLSASIGEVDISPDREKLEYTPKTVEALNNKLFTIFETIKDDIQAKIDVCKYPWEAVQMILSLSSSFGGCVKINEVSSFTFKGQKIEHPKTQSVMYRASGGKYYGSRCIPTNQGVSEYTVLVLADDDARIIPSRLGAGIKQKYGFTPDRFIVSKDKETYEKLFCAYWKPEQIVVDYKSLWAKVGSRGKRLNSSDVLVHYTKERYGNSIKASEISDNKNFVATTGPRMDCLDQKDLVYVSAAKNLGIAFYYVNQSKVKYLDKTWKPLSEVMKEYVKKEIAGFDKEIFLVKKHFNDKIPFGGALKTFIKEHENILIKCGDKDAVEAFKKYNSIYSNPKFDNMIPLEAVANQMDMKIDIAETADFKAAIEKISAFFKKYSLGVKVYEYCGWRVENLGQDVRSYVYKMNGIDK